MASQGSKTTPFADFWPDFIAGSIAGSSGLFIGHPLDTIKVRKQSSFHYPRHTVLFTKSESLSVSTKLKVLYRGLTFPLITEGVRQSVFFGCYGLTLKYLEKMRDEGYWYGGGQNAKKSAIKYGDIVVASAVGGTFQSFLATPVEQLKVTQQAQRSSKQNVVGSGQFLRKAFKSPFFLEHSAQTLKVTVLRETSSYVLYMTTYAWMVDKLTGKVEEQKGEGRFANKSFNHFCICMFSGGMAGVLSWALNIPVDNIKTRLQVQFCTASPRYTGISDCFWKVCRQEGIRSLWSGLGVVCLRAFPVNAVTLTVYTYSLDWLS